MFDPYTGLPTGGMGLLNQVQSLKSSFGGIQNAQPDDLKKVKAMYELYTK